eukprot:TRINITY_DN24150_c0_g1_i11.p4 TRINITY_DN24150_c0_g1~~TRINITY_DN24150_c0_g1_i11.p4  ORF type:complete len:113 (-),score=21.55 TRINITY_DN24150_c0_g1_i11:235-573(-)
MSVKNSVKMPVRKSDTGAKLQNGVREDVREDAREDDVRDKIREDVREDAREDEREDARDEVRDDVCDDGSRCSYKYLHLETSRVQQRARSREGCPHKAAVAALATLHPAMER